jgi:hypothetical protein
MTIRVNHVRIVKVIVLESRVWIVWLSVGLVVSVSGSMLIGSDSSSSRASSIESLVIMTDVTGTGDGVCSTANLQWVHINTGLSSVFT